MASGVGRKLLRAQLGGSKVYRLFNIVFAVIIFIVVALSIMWNAAGRLNYDFVFLFVAALLGCAAGFLALSISARTTKTSKSGFIVSICVIFVAILGIQVLVAYSYLPVLEAEMQNSVVYKSAVDFVLDAKSASNHFLLNAADAGYYTLLWMIFSLLHLIGFTQFAIPVVVLNIVAVSISMLLLVLVANRLFGRQKARHSLVLCAITAPLMLYVPFCTSELICLPFPIAIVLLWLKMRTHWRSNSIKRAFVCFGGMALLTAVGTLLKTSILIVFIATGIDLLVTLRGKGRALSLLVGFVFTIGCIVGLSFLIRHNKAIVQSQGVERMPITAGILMGLKNAGGYDDALQAELEAMPSVRERQNYISKELGIQLKTKGVLGFVQHIGNKISNTYSDGYYGSGEYIQMTDDRNTILHMMFSPNGRSYSPMVYIIYAFRASMLFFVGLGSLKAFNRKNPALTFIRIALFGVMLYQLIWVSEASYLICYLPLYILAYLEAGPVVKPKQELSVKLDEPQNVADIANTPEETQELSLDMLMR